MTANDPGHINNLGRAQTNALRQSWRDLIDAISNETSLEGKHIADSVYGDELFRAIGYDNPDVLMLRWLRSRKWNISASVSQMLETLKWRHEWGVGDLVALGERGISEEEISTNKTYFMGHDKKGRPVCCIHPKEHIKGQFPHETSEKLTVFCVETYRKLLKPPIESVTVIFDMDGCDMKNMDFHQVKFLIHLLDNYYPDSLGVILILNTPWVLDKCWAVIKSWLHPSVEQKVYFIRSAEELAEYVDLAVLPKRLYGNQPDFQYIPPTAEDKTMYAAFRADTTGKAIAEAGHRDAVRNYLAVTLQWAHGDESRTSLLARRKARKQLRVAFEQLSPYISTRTHYHRVGVIEEPIFQIAYDKLIHEKAPTPEKTDNKHTHRIDSIPQIANDSMPETTHHTHTHQKERIVQDVDDNINNENEPIFEDALDDSNNEEKSMPENTHDEHIHRKERISKNACNKHTDENGSSSKMRIKSIFKKTNHHM